MKHEHHGCAVQALQESMRRIYLYGVLHSHKSHGINDLFYPFHHPPVELGLPTSVGGLLYSHPKKIL